MNTYRVCMVENRWRGKILSEKYVKGLRAVRALVPGKLHYSRNAREFWYWSDKYEYFVIKE